MENDKQIEKQAAECREAFEKWFSPGVHNEQSLRTLGLKTMLWAAFQIAWQSRPQPDVTALVEALPSIYGFRINPIGQKSIEVDGNKWFCHAHEVDAFRKAAIAAIAAHAVPKPDNTQALVEALRHLVEACPEPQEVSMGFDSPPEFQNERDHYLAMALHEARKALARYEGKGEG